MRDDDWAAPLLLLAGGSAAEEGTLLAGTAALLASAPSSVGMRSRMTPLSSEGAGWCAARVTKACAGKGKDERHGGHAERAPVLRKMTIQHK